MGNSELAPRAAQIAFEVGFLRWVPTALSSAVCGAGGSELCRFPENQDEFARVARARGIPEDEIAPVLEGRLV